MFTFNADREFESGHVEIQVKATDHLAILKASPAIAFKVEVAHLKTWQEQPLPVILVVYDTAGDGRAYWLYVQNYMNNSKIKDADVDQDRITLHVPTENRLDAAAIERFRGFRDKVLAQVRGVISNEG
jgi:hypothetical protein